MLTGAGKEAVTGVDLTVKADVDRAFADVNDVGGLARLALELENTAAATYLSGIGVLGDTGASRSRRRSSRSRCSTRRS